ncbi:MAG: hydrogenase iron-sulfur subunit [Candidatus Thorarchaeota archaeon]
MTAATQKTTTSSKPKKKKKGKFEPRIVAFCCNWCSYAGADLAGVLISGCHPGDCHYTSGNLKMRGRFALLKKLVEDAGIHPDRIHLQWASAAEGDVFTKGVTEMVKRIKKIGPNPVRKGE